MDDEEIIAKMEEAAQELSEEIDGDGPVVVAVGSSEEGLDECEVEWADAGSLRELNGVLETAKLHQNLHHFSQPGRLLHQD